MSSKEEISLSAVELSGTVVKQGYLAKQVWPSWSGEQMGSSQARGRQESLQRAGRAETARGTDYQQNLLKSGSSGSHREQIKGHARVHSRIHEPQTRGRSGKSAHK